MVVLTTSLTSFLLTLPWTTVTVERYGSLFVPNDEFSKVLTNIRCMVNVQRFPRGTDTLPTLTQRCHLDAERYRGTRCQTPNLREFPATRRT